MTTRPPPSSDPCSVLLEGNVVTVERRTGDDPVRTISAIAKVRFRRAQHTKVVKARAYGQLAEHLCEVADGQRIRLVGYLALRPGAQLEIEHFEVK